MTDAQGKKFINLTGLHLFWQNVIKPKFDVLAGAVEDHGTQLSTLSADKADNSRFNSFGTTGKTIEKVIEDLSVAAGISGLKVNNTGNTLITVKANGDASDTQHSGVVTLSIDETALNTKFETIDGAINGKANQSDLEGVVTRIGTAEGKITTLEGAISGEGGINSKIAGLESNKADKTDLEGAVTRIGTAEGQIATLEGAISGEGGINSKIAGLESNKADKTDLEGAVTRIGTAEGEIAGLKSSKANQSDLDTANGKIATAEGKIATLEGAISGEGGINSKIAGLESSKANQSDLDTANGKITTAEGKIATLEGTIVTKANQADLETANGKITTAEGKIATLEGTIVTKANQADLETANGKITTAEGKITALEIAVEALSSATDFIGVTSTAISDGSATNPVKINEQDYTAVKGDIVIYGNKEFIWDGAKWVELGDTTALAQDVETLKTASETNANTALLVSEVEAAFNAGWM